MGCAFVHLQPTNDAMVGQVLGNARFRDTEVLGELRLDRFSPAGRATTQKIGNGDSQGLTCLHIIVGSELAIGEHPDAWPRRGRSRIFQLGRIAGQEPSKIHFELGEPRREPWIARASPKRGSRRFGFTFKDARGQGRDWTLFDYGLRSGRWGDAGFFGRGGRLEASARALVIPATTASAAVPLVYWTSGRGGRFRRPLHFRWSTRIIGASRFWQFRRRYARWLEGGRCFEARWWGRDFSGNGGAEARGAFLSLGFPVGAAKAVGSGQIPFAGIVGVARGFKVAGQLEGDHSIPRFREKRGKLSSGILASAGPANTCGDLLPVSHVLRGILTATRRFCQQSRAGSGRHPEDVSAHQHPVLRLVDNALDFFVADYN